MITGPDLHRLRHSLQFAADEAQMKSGAKQSVVLITAEEAREVLDALSELVDRRIESNSERVLDRGDLESIVNRALDALENQALVADNVNSILNLVSTLLEEGE